MVQHTTLPHTCSWPSTSEGSTSAKEMCIPVWSCITLTCKGLEHPWVLVPAECWNQSHMDTEGWLYSTVSWNIIPLILFMWRIQVCKRGCFPSVTFPRVLFVNFLTQSSFPNDSVGPPAMQKTQEIWAQSLDWEDPLEEEMATSILKGRIYSV